MGALDGLGKVANKLIDGAKLGSRAATLHRPGSDGAYNPATGDMEGGGSGTDVPCQAVLYDFTVGQIDGTLVQLGDRRALVSRIALSGVRPVPQADTLEVDSETWQIVRVLPYSTGEQDAAYELHVRR